MAEVLDHLELDGDGDVKMQSDKCGTQMLAEILDPVKRKPQKSRLLQQASQPVLEGAQQSPMTVSGPGDPIETPRGPPKQRTPRSYFHVNSLELEG